MTQLYQTVYDANVTTKISLLILKYARQVLWLESSGVLPNYLRKLIKY